MKSILVPSYSRRSHPKFCKHYVSKSRMNPPQDHLIRNYLATSSFPLPLSSSVDTTDSTAHPISIVREGTSSCCGMSTFRFFDECLREVCLSLLFLGEFSSPSSSEEKRSLRLSLVWLEPRLMPNKRASAASNSSLRKLRRGSGGREIGALVCVSKTAFRLLATLLSSEPSAVVVVEACVVNPLMVPPMVLVLWFLVAVVAKEDETNGMDAERDMNRRAAGGPSGTELVRRPATKDLGFINNKSGDEPFAFGVICGCVVKTSLAMEGTTEDTVGTAVIPGRDADRWRSCSCCIRSVDFILQIKSARLRNSMRRCRLYSMYRKASIFPSSSMHCIKLDGRRCGRRNVCVFRAAVSVPATTGSIFAVSSILSPRGSSIVASGNVLE